jgi:hypothetical protein
MTRCAEDVPSPSQALERAATLRGRRVANKLLYGMGMKALIAAFVGAMIVRSIVAAEPIDGAFGMRLGDKFAGPLSEIKSSAEGKYRLGEFSPASPMPHFTHYSVSVTPESRVIYEIFIKGAFATEAEVLSFLGVMQAKYGGFSVKPAPPDPVVTFVTASGSKQISIFVLAGHNVMVAYRDLVIMGVAKMEGESGTEGQGF